MFPHGIPMEHSLHLLNIRIEEINEKMSALFTALS